MNHDRNTPAARRRKGRRIECKALTKYDEKAEREYLRKEALEEGREEGREEGEERVSRLTICLLERGRADDLLRAAKDKDFQKKLFEEFNL